MKVVSAQQHLLLLKLRDHVHCAVPGTMDMSQGVTKVTESDQSDTFPHFPENKLWRLMTFHLHLAMEKIAPSLSFFALTN